MEVVSPRPLSCSSDRFHALRAFPAGRNAARQHDGRQAHTPSGIRKLTRRLASGPAQLFSCIEPQQDLLDLTQIGRCGTGLENNQTLPARQLRNARPLILAFVIWNSPLRPSTAPAHPLPPGPWCSNHAPSGRSKQTRLSRSQGSYAKSLSLPAPRCAWRVPGESCTRPC